MRTVTTFCNNNLPSKQVSSGVVEGGPFNCSVPGYEITTESLEEWNKHCVYDHPDGHLERGTAVCYMCSDEIRYEGKPFTPFDLKTGSKTFQLECDECFEKKYKNIKTKKLKKQTVEETKKNIEAGLTQKQ